MTESSPRRAAIYCRISQDKTGAGLGVERQEQDCRELAAHLGWLVVEVFCDNDLSAYSGKRRPRYHAMLDAIRDVLVDAVLAWHTNRLHRSPVELEEYISVRNEGREVPTHCVRAGTLDASDQLTMAAHIWVKRKQPWVVLAEGVPAWDEAADPAQFAQALMGG